MAKKTILYVDHTARWSGGEISLGRLLSALNPELFRPVVALAEEGPLADRLREMTIAVHIVPMDDTVRNTRKDSLDFGGITRKLFVAGPQIMQYAAKIAALARQENADLLHCNSLKSDIYGAIAGKMCKKPVIWHVRDFIDPTYLPQTTVVAFRSAAKVLPTHILTNSQATLECLFPTESGREKATVAHNGLAERDLLFDEPAERTTWAGQDAVRIGLVGRLAHWKGQHVLVEAVKLLKADRRAGRLPDDLPPVRFLIAGGALFGEEDYEAQVKAQGEPVAHCIEWLGAVKDIPALLAKLDIMVHTSVTPEPFGQVVIEGMAAGLPVIATRGGGVPEIITEGKTGMLTPMGDAAALAVAVRSLLCDPAKAAQIGRAGYHEARARFTSHKTAAVVENVYSRLLSGSEKKQGVMEMLAGGRGVF
ncbi:MAG: glycosyltransferase family 4 protein [Armatimonadetes bacterium]|nr:glycosyltransferase family 4 protein [Armatimonadota bacterium]